MKARSIALLLVAAAIVAPGIARAQQIPNFEAVPIHGRHRWLPGGECAWAAGLRRCTQRRPTSPTRARPVDAGRRRLPARGRVGRPDRPDSDLHDRRYGCPRLTASILIFQRRPNWHYQRPSAQFFPPKPLPARAAVRTPAFSSRMGTVDSRSERERPSRASSSKSALSIPERVAPMMRVQAGIWGPRHPCDETMAYDVCV